MSKKMFSKGDWIITESETPAYFLYRLKKGTVSIHENGNKINSVKVGKGQKSVLLGILAVLREDRLHKASVRAESDVEVEQVYIDKLRNHIGRDVPESFKADLELMIDTILINNRIKSLKSSFAERELVTQKMFEDAPEELSEIFAQLTGMYESSLQTI